MIYTSYFAFVPKLPTDMLKMSIALFTPKWAKIDGYLPHLTPTEKLLRSAKSGAIPIAEAMQKYHAEILEKLSPTKVYDDLIKLMISNGKSDLALLCYEKPGEICHRRFVAEWLEKGNSISVPEYFLEDAQLSLI
jgi:uncharacterized protein YeaO (DUF488 family)